MIVNKLNRPFALLLLISGAVLFLFSSCQKVINVNLNSASPQVVVQGNISQAAPPGIQLTQTVNFSDPNTFPSLSGALVILSDNAGHIDTLNEEPLGSGNYTGNKITGTPGNTYALSITANGKNYTAISTMSAPVNIDTLTYGNGAFGRSKRINVVFTDPGVTTNYYHFVEFINRIQQPQIYVTNNELQSGQLISIPIRAVMDSISSGDTVTIQLQRIDVNVYNYYTSLENANGTGFNTAPANPTTNLSNGALGYFSAYGVSSKTIVIP